jgi:hypothetical protein
MKKYTWYWHCDTDSYCIKEVNQDDDPFRGPFDSFEEAKEDALKVLEECMQESAVDIAIAFEVHERYKRHVEKTKALSPQ